jgi:hypothetical protein
MAQTHSHSNVRNQPPDWVSGLDTGTLQLIGSKLDQPYVPGVLHLSSVCRPWRVAASQTPGLAITWRSRLCKSSVSHAVTCQASEQQYWRQLVERSLQPWLYSMASRLDTFELQSTDYDDYYVGMVCAALQQAAAKAAAAGGPLPLRKLQLPLSSRHALSNPPAAVVALLPHLRQLSLPLSILPANRAGLLAALGSLPHLTSLEVGLGLLYDDKNTDNFKAAWEDVMQAAPKQLQHLAVTVERWDYGTRAISYTWEPLAAFPQLKQLRLDAVRGKDLALLAALPSLTSLGLQWGGRGL